MIDSKNSSPTPAPIWQGANYPVPAPGTTVFSPPDTPASAADELLKRTVLGAHTTIDRLAEKAAPTVRQVGESVASAEDALHAKTVQLRETRDQLSESLRTVVRNNPLASLAGAFAVGALIARLTR